MVENKGSDKRFNYIVLLLMLAFAFVTCLPLLYVIGKFVLVGENGQQRRGIFDSQRIYSGKLCQNFIKQCDFNGIQKHAFLCVYGNDHTAGASIHRGISALPQGYEGEERFQFYFSLTMFVSGGMIPTYIVVKGLNMLNTVWAMIIPGCVSVFNVIVIRTFMQSLPWEMQEAAMLDGSGNIRIFLTIVLPLCRAIIAVMLLYAIVGYWNAYFNSLLYITNDDLFPLQRVIQRILVANDASSSGDIGIGEQGLTSEVLKYVTIVVSSIPLIVIYPFFNKYFETGLMIGGLKG